MDETTHGRQGVKVGNLGMTVFQDAKGQGKGAMIADKNVIEGNTIMEGSDLSMDETGYIMWIPWQSATADNVGEFDNQ